MNDPHPFSNTPIFHKFYGLYKLLNILHGTIPKSQRYTLWQRCENINLNLLELLLEANHKQANEKLKTLYKLSHQLDLLKMLIRLAKENKVIHSKKYVEIQTILQEGGKMLGGWIKSVSH